MSAIAREPGVWLAVHIQYIETYKGIKEKYKKKK
jgi:hypothetical protein